jgi:DNA-binding NarL/FixJ family response regulator
VLPAANRYTPLDRKIYDGLESMRINLENVVSVLLVCPQGLERASLYTTVNAIPNTMVIAKVAGVDSALHMAELHNPDVLLADAYFLKDEMADLLQRIKEIYPEMIRVVLTAVSSQKNRLQQNGADYVLNYSNLDQRFPQILSTVQAKKQIHSAPGPYNPGR